MKSYKELFEKEFNTSQQIDETFAKICNEQGFRKGIEYLKSINCEQLDYDGYTILYTINELTKVSTTDEEKMKLLERISSQEDVVEAKIEKMISLKFHKQLFQKKTMKLELCSFQNYYPMQ